MFNASAPRAANGSTWSTRRAMTNWRPVITGCCSSTEFATARDGLRWHLIEQSPGQYDFSSATGMLRAGRDTGMQVIWDLWHYGWPDDIDIFSAAFVDRFTAFAREAAARISEYTEAPLISPINEISFFSWAAGEGGIFNPFAKHRGDEMKRQLVAPASRRSMRSAR